MRKNKVMQFSGFCRPKSFYRRRCASQKHQPAPLCRFMKSECPGVIMRGRIFLLVRGIVFFVENDQIVFKRRKDGAACSYHDRRPTRQNGEPGLPFYRSGQCGVYQWHFKTEALGKPFGDLRSKTDFRHKHENFFPESQSPLGKFHINPSFTASRNAMQQRPAKSRTIEHFCKSFQRRLLFQRQRRFRFPFSRRSFPSFIFLFALLFVFRLQQGIQIIAEILGQKNIQRLHGRRHIIPGNPIELFHIAFTKSVTRLMRKSLFDFGKSGLLCRHLGNHRQRRLPFSQLDPHNAPPPNLHGCWNGIGKNHRGLRDVNFTISRKIAAGIFLKNGFRRICFVNALRHPFKNSFCGHL